ncbi:polyhydroxybutyrate depolymerase [Streptomyces sp. G44]|uniref:alpha/beta hydrolase family esterase n=1 Tax=Streptomyces sp. G44 TaxID=2807632 RepID=UPI001961C6CD|nr:PHB depolymerase family esterase [Streptomyces sp. G44]MBM7173178.1 polyhydroxybutyrate depolymerase [Streptomyces sp. G44]
MPTLRAPRRLSAVSLAVAALLLPLTGCGSDGRGPTDPRPPKKPAAAEIPRPGDHRVTLSWQGEKRVYTVHAPPGYTPSAKLPLVIAMHPYPADGKAMAAISGLNSEADEENFLVAYPDGLNRGFNALICCGTEDDVGFVRTITKRLTTTWHADPSRIYATGISNGGDMAYKLAVELPGTFAAIAPVSSGYLGTDAAKTSYMPKTPVSVITFIGGLDEHYGVMDAGIDSWQQRLSCDSAEPRKLKNNISRTTAKCRDGSDVVVYRMPEMGHSWPGGGGGSMSDPQAGIDATGLMVEFFKARSTKAP